MAETEEKKRKIKVYLAGHCGPCAEVRELAEKGKFVVDGEPSEIDLVDIESEEGFDEMPDYLDGIPAAYEQGKICKLEIDRENDLLIIGCDQSHEQDDKGT